MVKREIVLIDDDKCNGCGLCVKGCHEGALQMIDGKARLISDLFCDGLGACVGECPVGAITIIKRDAPPYDEVKVMKENIVPKGINTIKAHLEHLRDHGADKYFNEAVEYLEEIGMKNPIKKSGKSDSKKEACGCPGSKIMDFSEDKKTNKGKIDNSGTRNSELKQWPIQMHLINPNAPYFLGKDVVIAADCVAFSIGDFHKDYLSGRSLGIACPKLDDNQGVYIEKITAMIDEAKINTLTVMIMEVPCCGGLLQMAKQASSKAKRKVPIKAIVVGLRGNIISENWV